ncbi:hypothetical protein GNP85_18570 [Aliivibrio fischeri]|uniref:hypothetical protein n=1 Tax=Aliivibrio fischeri TaxID=668 RepID=UPI0012DAD672|nr:hypothetical protein [Aliivibrio fischeri]MUK86584.1 hypothetical protein [Aliivibrio fischeri]
MNTLNASVLVGVGKLEQLSMNGGVDSVVNNDLFENTIDILIRGLNSALIKSVEMPSIWAYAFLASLAAVLAQLMYQVWCPEPVKTMTLRAYIFSRLDSVKKVEDSYKVRNAASIASIEYKQLETLTRPAFLVCFVLYSISILTLLYVVVLQSLNVGVAVGWEWAGCILQKLT